MPGGGLEAVARVLLTETWGFQAPPRAVMGLCGRSLTRRKAGTEAGFRTRAGVDMGDSAQGRARAILCQEFGAPAPVVTFLGILQAHY